MIKLLNLLKEEHSGSEGFEAVLVSPIMFATFFLLMYFFFMTLTFISYNNVANSIAQDLNMRQTGYQTAINTHPYAPRISTYKNNIGPNGEISGSGYLSASQITVEPYTKALLCGTYFALDKYSKQFSIPFAEVTKVEVVSTKPINPSEGKGMAGAVIRVKIHYTTMALGRAGKGLIPMTAVGYGIIA